MREQDQDQPFTSLKLWIDHDAAALICCYDRCRCAISVRASRATSHLRHFHGISTDQKKGLTQQLAAFQLRNPEDIPALEDGSPQHPQLRIYEGFACNQCKFRTTSLQIITKRHFSRGPEGYSCSSATAIRKFAARKDDFVEPVRLQTWITGPGRKYWIIANDGNAPDSVGNRQVNTNEVDHYQSVQERENERDRIRGMRVAETWIDNSGTPSLSFAEQRPWLERTGWEATFKKKSRHLLAAIVSVPRYGSDAKPYLLLRKGVDGLEEDLVSPASDELRIAQILRLFDPMMDRCEETAKKTSRNVLCWLKSVRLQSSYPKPFTLVRQPSSTRKYRAIFKQALAFVFRIYRLDPTILRKIIDVQLRKRTLVLLDRIWHDNYWQTVQEDCSRTYNAGAGTSSSSTAPSVHAGDSGSGELGLDSGDDDSSEIDQYTTADEEDCADDEEDLYEDDDDNDNDNGGSSIDCEDDMNVDLSEQHNIIERSAQQARDVDGRGGHAKPDDNVNPCETILELLFGVCISLCKEHPIDSHPSSMTLHFFSGILGFSKSLDAFLPARSFTSHLSALIYIQRLLFLEYALPLRAYSSLGIKRRPRNQQLDRLNPIRKSYMVIGSESSFEEFFTLRSYGRVMARSDTPPFLLRWSEDGQTVHWGSSSKLSMDQMRLLLRRLIEQAAEICDELLFGLECSVDLSKIKDDITNSKRGFSFVTHPENDLADEYLKLFRRACTADQGKLSSTKGQWNWKAVCGYLAKEKQFSILLASIMYLSGGQVPRWSELLNIWCVNGEFVERNVFVYKSMIMYLIRHHKAKRSANNEFIVARFLPAEASQLVYKYLAVIRPFIDLIGRERNGDQADVISATSPLLFRAQIDFGSKPLDSAQVNRAFRQKIFSVWNEAVNSRTLRQLCIGITEKHVREVYQPFNRFDDKSDKASRNVVFAWQSGHRPLLRGSTYGLDGAFPTTLQPQLLELYEWASLRWHEFLELPSKHAPEIKDSADSVASLDSRLATLKRQPIIGVTAAASPLAQEYMPEPEPEPRTIPAKRKFTLSCGQQLAWHDEPQTKYTKPSNFLLHLGGSSLTHIVPPTSTDKINAADLHSSSLQPPVRPYYTTNCLNDLETQFCASPTGEAFPIGPHRPPLSSKTTQDSNKHQYIIHGRNLAALHDKQQELKSFNVFLHQYLTRRQSSSLMHERLSRMIETTRWWGSIGCPLCFLCKGAEAEHTLHRCKRDELRNKALSIIRWLENLRIPQHTSKGESCSICLSFYACGEAAGTTQDSDFGTYCTRDSMNDPYSDGRCEIKPIIRMAIASLAAYDGHLFANMLAKVPLAIDAEVWFERRIPYDGRWFSNLLLVYEEVMLAFYYSRNMRRGKGPLLSFPSHPPAPEPPAYQAIGKAYPEWDTAEEVASWEAAIGRWEGKCPICAGRGMGGQDIQHALRQCTRGGSQTLRSELAVAMYEDGIAPKNGCDTCHIPHDFCDDWARMDDGEWDTITTAKGVLCQFERHLLYDTIIGLYHCGQRDIVEEFHSVAYEYCVQRGLNVAYDQKTIALALSQQITVNGVAGSQLLRTLVVLTSVVLYKVKRDKEDENSVHLL